MASIDLINRIKELFLEGRIVYVKFSSLPEVSDDIAGRIISAAERRKPGSYMPIDEVTHRELSALKARGEVPLLDKIDVDGLTAKFARGLTWVGGNEVSVEEPIAAKQRVRIRKMIANGLLPNMTDSEISLLSAHEAEVLIKRAAAGLERVTKKIRKQIKVSVRKDAETE